MKYCTEDLKRAKRSTTASRFQRPEKNRPQKTLAGKAAGNLSRNQGYGSPGHQTKPKLRELNHLNIHGVNDLDSAPYPGFANTEREKHLIFQFSISPASHTRATRSYNPLCSLDHKACPSMMERSYLRTMSNIKQQSVKIGSSVAAAW